MTNTIAKWLALALCAVLTLSGCGLVSIDKETEQAQQNATVVAEYTGGTVTYADAIAEYQNWLSYYEAYGYSITSDADKTELKQQVLDTLVQQKIIEAKAKEMGLTDLSEDEKADILSQAQAEYEDAVTYYMDYLQGDTDQETRQNAVDYLDSIGYTLESIEQYDTENAWQEKLKDEITKDVTVSDEAVQTTYDASVAEDQESFTDDTYNFENAATYGDTITWVPEGYRAVKHILLTLPEEDSSSLIDLESQIEDVNVRIEELQNPEATEAPAEEGDASAFSDAISPDEAVAAADSETTASPDATASAEAAADETLASGEEDFTDEAENLEGDTAETAAVDDAALENLTLPELETKKDELTKQLDALKTAAIAKLQPKIDEIQAKIASGEDFDKLIEEYGEDDGMKTEPTKTNGYYVSADSQMWDDAFTTAAMALQKVGDVSEPVLSQSGVHIIKYIADVTSGAVPLDQVREEIKAEALETAKNDRYDETVQGWVTAANAKTYVDKLVDPTA